MQDNILNAICILLIIFLLLILIKAPYPVVITGLLAVGGYAIYQLSSKKITGGNEYTGSYEEFDKEINELDFLETEDEVKKVMHSEPTFSNRATNTKNNNKNLKHKKENLKHKKGSAEIQGGLKSIVETLNESGHEYIKPIYEEMLENPECDVLEKLTSDTAMLKEAYDELHHEQKNEIDEIVEFLDIDELKLFD